ncbi:MAG: SRPBCC family protein [Candidatus Nitrotoga sp.]
MVQIIILIIVTIMVSTFIYAASRHDAFRIERSTDIQATPEKIFALINDFKQWEAWSPWEKIDPALKRTYSGPASGIGAVYAWQGNKNVGQGCMEIIEASPFSKVTIKLDLIAPFAAHNTVEFTLVKKGSTTKLTQAMYGSRSYISKLMGLFFSMEKMVGGKYEEGLANLKNIAEQ